MTGSSTPVRPHDWRLRALLVAVLVLVVALAAVAAWSAVALRAEKARFALQQVSAATVSMTCDGRPVPYTSTAGRSRADVADPDRIEPGFLVDFTAVRRSCDARIAIENRSRRTVTIERYELPLLGNDTSRPLILDERGVAQLGRRATVGAASTVVRPRVSLKPDGTLTIDLHVVPNPTACQAAGTIAARAIEVRVNTPHATRTFSSADRLKIKTPELRRCFSG